MFRQQAKQPSRGRGNFVATGDKIIRDTHSNVSAGGFFFYVEGAMMFLFEALRKAKTMSRGREIFPSGKILVIHIAKGKIRRGGYL